MSIDTSKKIVSVTYNGAPIPLPSANIEVDKTLTISGAAADAKEVGDRFKVLEDWMAVENYKPISISYFYVNGYRDIIKEVGESVSKPQLSWQLTKEAEKITLDVVEVAGTSYEDQNTYKTSYGSSSAFKTWTLKATEKIGKPNGGKATAQARANLYFYHRVYWGVGATAKGFDSDFVKALAHSELTTSKAITLNVSPSTQYIYYAVPKDLCDNEPIFIIDKGFAGGFEYKEEITVTNSYGAEIVYYVYRSDQLLVGSTRVDVS